MEYVEPEKRKRSEMGFYIGTAEDLRRWTRTVGGGHIPPPGGPDGNKPAEQGGER